MLGDAIAWFPRREYWLTIANVVHRRESNLRRGSSDRQSHWDCAPSSSSLWAPNEANTTRSKIAPPKKEIKSKLYFVSDRFFFVSNFINNIISLNQVKEKLEQSISFILYTSIRKGQQLTPPNPYDRCLLSILTDILRAHFWFDQKVFWVVVTKVTSLVNECTLEKITSLILDSPDGVSLPKKKNGRHKGKVHKKNKSTFQLSAQVFRIFQLL
jgi:hypothetical protein